MGIKALAMDLGGSGGKMFAGLFDGHKIDFQEVHRFPNRAVYLHGHHYWDILAIYNHLLDGMRAAAPLGFTSLGIDAFCNDYGLLDSSGNLLSQVYAYRDPRTEGVQASIDRRMAPMDLYRRTGCQRARFNTLVQLVAQSRQAGGFLLQNTDALLFLPDLLNYFLCGETAAEFTIASVSQIHNRAENDWDADILRAFDLPERIFPAIVPPAFHLGACRGEILDCTGVKPFRVTTVGHHDTASAVLAVPSLEKHFAYISSGTWSLMGTETDEMITTPESLRANFANEGGVGGRNRFLKNIMGLWILQESLRQLGRPGRSYTFEELDQLSRGEPAFRSIIDPDDPEFFQPGDMLTRIRRKCLKSNQPAPETPGALNRCIKESLALAYRRTLEQIETLTGFSIPFVHIVGGGARSDLLNQMAASAMQRPVYAGPSEAAGLGNLCAQFMASGELSDIWQVRAAVRASIEIKEFLPNESAAWQDAYARFQRITDHTSSSLSW